MAIVNIMRDPLAEDWTGVGKYCPDDEVTVYVRESDDGRVHQLLTVSYTRGMWFADFMDGNGGLGAYAHGRSAAILSLDAEIARRFPHSARKRITKTLAEAEARPKIRSRSAA